MAPDPTDDIALAERLIRIEEGIKGLSERIEQEVRGLRSDLTHYFSQLADHEARLRVLEREQSQHCIQLKAHANRIDSLANRINAWGATNSIGAAIAAFIGWFK